MAFGPRVDFTPSSLLYLFTSSEFDVRIPILNIPFSVPAVYPMHSGGGFASRRLGVSASFIGDFPIFHKHLAVL